MIRIGLARVLQAADIRVVGETADPLEALAIVKVARPDLLVVGDRPWAAADVVQRAKSLDPAPLVVVLLGRVSPDELTAFMAAGTDALLARSVGAEELVAAVMQLFDGGRVVAPALVPSLVGLVDVSAGPGSSGLRPTVALTTKEREVLARLADGSSNDEIASALYMSAATVKTHLKHIYGKLGAKSRHEAVARAVSLRLLE
jgi:DNA-binding NarL/FixJ family response regulator